jgi:hypothetical protein
MKIYKATVFFLLLQMAKPVFCQEKPDAYLEFQPVIGGQMLQLDSHVFIINSVDSITFETFRFYISNIELLKNDAVVWKENNSFHLIDASNKSSLQIIFASLPVKDFDQISFNIGIDSSVNVAGAAGGALDPTNGMYWTWQSGYINFKLEGRNNRCNTRNNEFQFHIGGYKHPYNTLQTVHLPFNTNRNIIYVDIAELLSHIDFKEISHIMSAGKTAKQFSNVLPRIFSIAE